MSRSLPVSFAPLVSSVVSSFLSRGFCVASEYVDQIGAILWNKDFIKIKYNAARLIGLIEWRYPDKIKDVLPALVNEFEKMMVFY